MQNYNPKHCARTKNKEYLQEYVKSSKRNLMRLTLFF